MLLAACAVSACADTSDQTDPLERLSDAAVPPAPPTTDTVAWSPTSTQHRVVDAGGLKRDFILHVPVGAEQRAKLPVIFVFHGYLEEAKTIREYSGLDDADALVAYMQGVDNAWAPAPYATTSGEQDLAFVDAALNQLTHDFAVDRAQVFAAGLSNGGGFAAYLGCQRPQDFTAVATVAGAFYEKVSEGCSMIPMKHIDFHGTADPVIAYAGGIRHDHVYDSTAELMDDAAERNRCDPEPVEKVVSNDVLEQRWVSCDAGLEHYRIVGGGHVWPGGGKDSSTTAPSGFATRTLLDFFGVPLTNATTSGF